MPAYNAEKTILKAIKSLQYQTYTNWECIIVNDGSNDKTLNILNSLNDSRLRIYSFNENKGRGAARQFALEKCTGDFIAMLDADDWYYHDKLEKQINFLIENKDVDLVSCGMAIQKNDQCYAIRGTGNSIIKTFNLPSKVPVPHASSLFRKSISINQTYDINFKLSQDTDFLRRILLGKKFAKLDFIGYVYDEYHSTNFKKTLQSYRFSAKGYLKFTKEYPFTVIKNYLLIHLKIIRLYFKNEIFGFNSIIKSRSKEPTIEQKIEFQKNILMLKKQNSKTI